jgi:hypothetical protein
MNKVEKIATLLALHQRIMCWHSPDQQATVP